MTAIWQRLFPTRITSLDEKISKVEGLLGAHGTSIDYKTCEQICTSTRSIWYKLHSQFLLNPSCDVTTFERALNVFHKTTEVLKGFDDAYLDTLQREHLHDMIENVTYRIEKLAIVLDPSLSYSQKLVRLDSAGEYLEQSRTAKWASREVSSVQTR